MTRPGSSRGLRGRLRALDARVPAPVRWAIWTALGVLVLPWALRLYGAWWDLAFRQGHFLEFWLPR